MSAATCLLRPPLCTASVCCKRPRTSDGTKITNNECNGGTGTDITNITVRISEIDQRTPFCRSTAWQPICSRCARTTPSCARRSNRRENTPTPFIATPISGDELRRERHAAGTRQGRGAGGARARARGGAHGPLRTCSPLRRRCPFGPFRRLWRDCHSAVRIYVCVDVRPWQAERKLAEQLASLDIFKLDVIAREMKRSAPVLPRRCRRLQCRVSP